VNEAESILAALEPEDELEVQWDDPTITVAVDSNEMMLDPDGLNEYASMLIGDILAEAVEHSIFRPTRSEPETGRLSFDDVWGDALSQVSSETLVEVNECHDGSQDDHPLVDGNGTKHWFPGMTRDGHRFGEES